MSNIQKQQEAIMGSDVPSRTKGEANTSSPSAEGSRTARFELSVKQAAKVASRAISLAEEAAKTVREVVTSASAHQVAAQETIRKTIVGKSETLFECAKGMDGDAGRIRIAEIELEREREKTKQAGIAAEAARDATSLSRDALKVAGVVVVIAGVVLIGPQSLRALPKDLL